MEDGNRFRKIGKKLNRELDNDEIVDNFFDKSGRFLCMHSVNKRTPQLPC